jgi:hypothetical protein
MALLDPTRIKLSPSLKIPVPYRLQMGSWLGLETSTIHVVGFLPTSGPSNFVCDFDNEIKCLNCLKRFYFFIFYWEKKQSTVKRGVKTVYGILAPETPKHDHPSTKNEGSWLRGHNREHQKQPPNKKCAHKTRQIYSVFLPMAISAS